MEKIMKFFILVLCCCTGALFADSFILENEASFPKVAVQWASSARDVQDSNDLLIQEELIPPSNLCYLNQGKTAVAIPKNAIYFRIVAWQTKQPLPDFLTNWVEITPSKTYLIKDEHLTPALLMNGVGC